MDKATGETAGSQTASSKKEARPKRLSERPPAQKKPPATPTGAAPTAPAAETKDVDVVGLGPAKAPAAETQNKTPDAVPAAPESTPPAKAAAAPAKKAEELVDDVDDGAAVAPRKTKPAAGKEKAAKPEPAGEAAATAGKDEPVDAASVLGLKKKEAVKAAPAKAPEPAAVLAAEPSFLPFDVDKMDSGKDKNFATRLIKVLPGWHGKNINDDDTPDAQGKSTNATKVGTTHRGRDGVLEINPINDTLAARLIATIEVPQKSKAKLLFEIASKDAAHEWLLSASVANTPIVQKFQVKTKKGLEWLEVPLDLSASSGKRVEVVLEVAMKPKTPSAAYKEQVGYFRNIRLEWPGKPAGAQAPGPAPKPPTPAVEPKPPPPAEEPKAPVEEKQN
ncbi:MAG: hypothetical protein ABSE73_08650 [Planctomycetota bacterium]